MSAEISSLLKLRGLSDEEFNFFVLNYFNCSEIAYAAAFKTSTESGLNILILKAGSCILDVSNRYRRFQKGYNSPSENEFSKSVFERELNSADLVLIPVSINYRHNGFKKNRPSKLNFHSNHGILIIYYKTGQNYILVDSKNLHSKNHPLLRKVHSQVVTFFRQIGLKGDATCHKFDEPVPFPFGCGPAVLWNMKNVLQNPSWRPTPLYGGDGGVMFRLFAHQIIDFFSACGLDLTETQPSTILNLESGSIHLPNQELQLVCAESSGQWISDDQILAEAGIHCFKSSSSSSEPRRRGLRKKLKAHRRSPPVKRDQLASVLGDFDVGGEKEVTTTSRYKLRKRTVISGTDELKLRRKTREKKA